MSSMFSDDWPVCIAREELVIFHLSGLGLSQQLQNCRRLDPLFKLLAVILYCIATPRAELTPQHTNTGMAKEKKKIGKGLLSPATPLLFPQSLEAC